MITEKVKCSDCRWYLIKSLQDGFCRRYPPVALVIPATSALGASGTQIAWTSPSVLPTNYCGEFSLAKLKETD